MEERSTHVLQDNGNIGAVQIADDVVAMIAGLAAREVAGQTLTEVKSAMKIKYFDDLELIKSQSEKYAK